MSTKTQKIVFELIQILNGCTKIKIYICKLDAFPNKVYETGVPRGGGQGGHLAPGPSFKRAPSSYFRLNSRNMASFCAGDPAT